MILTIQNVLYHIAFTINHLCPSEIGITMLWLDICACAIKNIRKFNRVYVATAALLMMPMLQITKDTDVTMEKSKLLEEKESVEPLQDLSF